MSSIDLPEELQQFAFNKYGETPEIRDEKLLELRNRIAELPLDCQIKDMSDENLIRFLRMRKFDVEKALKGTINLAKFESEYPQIVGGTPSEYLVYRKFFQVLKERDQQGRTIVILRMRNMISAWTPEFQQEHPLVRGQIMMLDRLSRDVNVQVRGVVIVNCFVGMSFMEKLSLSKYTGPSDMRLISGYATKVLGIPLKRGFMIEPPTFVVWMFGIVRMFLSEKLRERVGMYHTTDELHEFVGNVDILPTILGGRVEDEDMYDWLGRQIQLHQSVS